MAKDERCGASPSAWSHWKENIGVNVWTSLVVASLAGMAFFVYFDPLLQGSDELPPSWLSHRPTTYIVGLMLFWLFTIAVSAMNAYLQASGPLPAESIRDYEHQGDS